MGDVPFSVVVGVIAGSPEPMAESGYLPSVAIACVNRLPSCRDHQFEDTMHVGVLAGEQRWSARNAGNEPV